MSTVRYLAFEKKTPATTEKMAEMFALAAYVSAGYEVLHKTTKGATFQPEMAGIPTEALAFMKVTFELVEEGK